MYRVEKDHPASGLINLRKNLEETGGVEHVGEQDGKIYLAFMDGRGGIISGQPAKISLEDYWQEDWFTNQKADPTVPSVVINSVEYLFTRQESAPEETVNQEEALGESALLEGEQQ